MKKPLVKYSKFLSLILRHNPSVAGIALDRRGWADVDRVLAASAKRGFPGDLETLRQVVETNDKRRFAFSEDGRKIRARQGHSIEVDLELDPTPPPETLYHGTATRFLAAIRETGLTGRGRQHVHLSGDIPTARKVGQRHGRPAILRVDAGAMHRGGHHFYLSENGVWLTDRVPPDYLRRIKPDQGR